MENALQAQQESLNFSAWLISALYALLKKEGYRPRNPFLFKKLMRSVSIHSVEQTRIALWLTHALVSARKEKHLNSSQVKLPEMQKQLLHMASPFEAVLFDPEVFAKIKASFVEATNVDFQRSMSEFATACLAERVKGRKGRSGAKGKSSSASSAAPLASSTQSPALSATSSAASRRRRGRGRSNYPSTPSRGGGAAKRARSRSRSRSPAAASKRGKGKQGQGFQ